jgi:hypothetical protein
LQTAARHLDVPYSTLRGWLAKSGVPTVRIGNYRFVDMDEARAVVDARHEKQRAQSGMSF